MENKMPLFYSASVQLKWKKEIFDADERIGRVSQPGSVQDVELDSYIQ